MSVVINKATLKGIFLSYAYSVTVNNIKNTNTTFSDAPIHDDLRKAFRNLIPFYAHICEEITDEELIKNAIKNPELYLERKEDDPEDKVYPLLKYHVVGFELGKKQDVKIVGAKWLESGESVGFDTPFVKLESDYKFIAELNAAIEVLKTEVFEYMQGKQAPANFSFGIGLDEEDDLSNDGI